MRGLLRNTDLIAGAGAVGLLLLAVFALGLSPPLGVGLAAATYAGLRLALPRGGGDDGAALAATLARCEEQITAIAQFAGWAGFAGKPAVQARLAAIGRIAGRVLLAIRQDQNKQGAAAQFLDGYLLPITDVLSQYVRLAARDLELARPELTALEEETLPLIERRLTALHEQIHGADLAALEIDTKMLEYTLQPIAIAPKRYTLEGLAPEAGSPGDDGEAPARAAQERMAEERSG